MKTIGFVISHKENEKRRALIPRDIENIKFPENIFIEKGYGSVLGYSDFDYLKYGVNVVSREETLKKDVICDPKIGDADYLGTLNNQIIFGWVHAVQNKEITDLIIENKLTAIAWEDMYEEGRHIFWRNNEIAGEAAVMHAYTLFGLFPYNTKVAIIGKGNTARGAIKILSSLGAKIMVYDRKTENLLRAELSEFDVIINAVLWDTSRTDHIISRTDLKRMKPGSMIIDISCDRGGGIESCVPTTIDNPIYVVEGIIHYCVDNTPSLFYKTISKTLSKICSVYINSLIEESEDKILSKARIIVDGVVVDERINQFQKR